MVARRAAPLGLRAGRGGVGRHRGGGARASHAWAGAGLRKSHLDRPPLAASAFHGNGACRIEVAEGVAVAGEEERLPVLQRLAAEERDGETRHRTRRQFAAVSVAVAVAITIVGDVVGGAAASDAERDSFVASARCCHGMLIRLQPECGCSIQCVAYQMVWKKMSRMATGNENKCESCGEFGCQRKSSDQRQVKSNHKSTRASTENFNAFKQYKSHDNVVIYRPKIRSNCMYPTIAGIFSAAPGWARAASVTRLDH